jgi:hypothetical protein
MGTIQVSASEPGSAAAQSEESNPALSVGNSHSEADESTRSRLGLSLLQNIALDQGIWTSPIHLRWADGTWQFPLAAAIGDFFATGLAVPPALSEDSKNLCRHSNISKYRVYSLVGPGGGLDVWSKLSRDEHQTEAGILAGELAINSFGKELYGNCGNRLLSGRKGEEMSGKVVRPRPLRRLSC